MVEQPPNFSFDYQDAWSEYVLEHELPSLPSDLSVDEAVPVSRWIGPTTAAVLHIRRAARRVAGEADGPENETDVQCLRLVGGSWQVLGGGGGGWKRDSPFTPIDIPAGDLHLHGMTAADGCTALYGEVGRDAAWTEVEQDGVVTRRRIEAPIGALVVCAESTLPFTVRVYAQGARLLDEHHEPALDLSRFAERFAALRRQAQEHPGAVTIRTASTWAIESGDTDQES